MARLLPPAAQLHGTAADDGHLRNATCTQECVCFRSLPRGEWPSHTVGEAMVRDWRPRSIRADADAMEAFAKMSPTGASRLLVTEGEQLVGIISLKDLLRFLELKLEFEGEDAIAETMRN